MADKMSDKRCESCGADADLKLVDGSFWCFRCDGSARSLGYDNKPIDVPRIRSTHWAAFRSGEWAQIVTEDEVDGRPCWLVMFPDGATDVWVKDDPVAQYEFAGGAF